MLYSFREAAKILGIDRNRLGRWAKSEMIRVVHLDGQPKISSAEVARIEREGVGPKPKRGKRPPRPSLSPGDEIRGIKV